MTKWTIDYITSEEMPEIISKLHGTNLPMKYLKCIIPISGSISKMTSFLPFSTLKTLLPELWCVGSSKYIEYFEKFAMQNVLSLDYLDDYEHGDTQFFSQRTVF